MTSQTLIEATINLMPNPLSFQHLGLGRGSRTLVQEWSFIRRNVKSILHRNFDTSLYSAVCMIGLGNSLIHAGGPRIVFISMTQDSDQQEWLEVAEDIQEFLDTLCYGLELRMEYEGMLGLALLPWLRGED